MEVAERQQRIIGVFDRFTDALHNTVKILDIIEIEIDYFGCGLSVYDISLPSLISAVFFIPLTF